LNKLHHYTALERIYDEYDKQWTKEDKKVKLKKYLKKKNKNYVKKLLSNGSAGLFIIPLKSITFRMKRFFRK